MALLCIIQHETGAASHYWRIGSTDFNYAQKLASITLLGYVSQDARQLNRVPLDRRVVSASGADFDLWFAPEAVDPNGNNQVKNSYLYVKSIAGGEFSSAADV
jgi:hypothetical protein